MLLSDFFSANDIVVDTRFQDLGYAKSDGELILTFCDSIHYLEVALNNKNVQGIILKEEILTEEIINSGKGIVKSSAPRDSFFAVYNRMYEKQLFKKEYLYGISKGCEIADSAIVSSKSHIGENSYIGENVVIKENVFIGKNSFIDAGVVIGSEGILYTESEGCTNFIRHAGTVIIGENVTILSNAVIVRSVFPNMPTKVDDYSIIGIATTIGHEASIGKNCKVLGNCVVAKNATISDNSVVGSSSVIRENIRVGRDANIKAGSIVVKDVEDYQVVSGNFAMEHKVNLKNFFKAQK